MLIRKNLIKWGKFEKNERGLMEFARLETGSIRPARPVYETVRLINTGLIIIIYTPLLSNRPWFELL